MAKHIYIHKFSHYRRGYTAIFYESPHEGYDGDTGTIKSRMGSENDIKDIMSHTLQI